VSDDAGQLASLVAAQVQKEKKGISQSLREIAQVLGILRVFNLIRYIKFMFPISLSSYGLIVKLHLTS